MKKIFALILALLMLLPAVVACKGDDEESSSSSPASSTPGSSESASGGDTTTPGGDDEDDGSRGAGNGFSSKDSVITTWPSNELNVLVTRYGESAGAPWGQVELNSKAFGDQINQAHLDRQKEILDTYGITVNWIEAKSPQNVVDDLNTANSSKDTTYEIAYPRAQEVQGVVSMVYDMNQSEYLDFNQPYFSQAAYDAFTVDGRTFFAAGDMDFSDNQTAYMLFYNKDMIEDIGGDPADVYEMVKKGTWTYDMLQNLSKQVKGDSDGVSGETDGDQFGYATKSLNRFYTYAGIFEADIDPDTNLFRVALNLDEEKVDKVITNIIQCASADWARENWGGSYGANATTAFNEGRVLFFEEVAQQIDNIGSITFKLGVVPCPKLNAEQDRYYVPTTKEQTTFVCIPKCSISKEMSCYFVDVLAWTGGEYIMEAYYAKIEAKMDMETVDDDMEIFHNYIFDNIVYDVGFLTNGWADFLTGVKSDAYANNTNNFTQVFGEAQEQAMTTVGTWNDTWTAYYEEIE